MTQIWSIQTNHSTRPHRTLEELGVQDLAITFRSRAADEAVFTIPGDAFGDVPWDFGDLYEIKRGVTVSSGGIVSGGTVVFKGRLWTAPRTATGAEERVEVRMAGLWRDLEQTVYMQPWKTGSGSASASSSRVILGCKADGTPGTMNWQLGDIIGAAGLEANVDVSAGTFPFDEQVDLTCADALNRVLAWCPDAMTCFDYTASPATLKIRRRSALTPAPVAAGACESLSCTARNDLQVPGVHIIFEKIGSSGGSDYSDTETQTYPAGHAVGRGTLVATLQVRKGLVRYLWQRVRTSSSTPAVGNTSAGIAQWQKWLPWLAADSSRPYTTAPSISGVAHYDAESGDSLSWPPSGPVPAGGTAQCPRELLEGEVVPWMNEAVRTVRVEALVSYATADETVHDRKISHTLVMTSAQTGNYNTLAESSPADPIPSDLAKQLYDALNPLHYEGQCVIAGEDPPGGVTTLHKLDISGGRSAWSSMGAAVQSVQWNVATGRTIVSFGTPEHLGPQDLLQFLQANRKRASAQSLPFKTSSSASHSSSASATGGTSRASDGTSGRGVESKRKFQAPGDNTHSVAIDGTTGTIVATAPGTVGHLALNPAAQDEPFNFVKGISGQFQVDGGALKLVLTLHKYRFHKVSNAVYLIEEGEDEELDPIEVEGAVCGSGS